MSKEFYFHRSLPNASIPDLAGKKRDQYNLYSAQNILVKPFENAIVPSGIAFQIPSDCHAYVQVANGSKINYEKWDGSALQKFEVVGNISIEFVNITNVPYEVNIGDKIGEFHIFRIRVPIEHEFQLIEVPKLAQFILSVKR